MQLLQSWKESLSIFKPANFKLFLMVTAKCVWETFKILFGRFWWLVILFLLGTVAIFSLFFVVSLFIAMSAHGGPPMTTGENIFLKFLTFVGSIFPSSLIFTIFLIVRSSVKMKNWSYLKTYLFSLYFIYVYLFLYLIYFLCSYTINAFIFLSPIANVFVHLSNLPSYVFFTFLLNVFSLLYSSLIVFTILFFLDSASANPYTFLVSFLRALKMTIYNFPFCLIVYLLIDVILFSALYLLLQVTFFSFEDQFFSIVKNGAYDLFLAFLAIIFYVIPVCIFTNFYIKQVHDNFDLYFGKGPSEKEGV